MTLADITAAYDWLRCYALALGTSVIRFTWFGGEPLLLGPDFLSAALDGQDKAFKDIEIANTIQTNLTLVREAWIPIFQKYFHGGVGCSVDFGGDWRVFPDGSSSKSFAERNIHLLTSHGVQVGVVCTLTRRDIGCAKEIYEYFKKLGVAFRVNRAASSSAMQADGLLLSVEEYDRLVCQIAEVYLSDPLPTIDFRNVSLMVRAYLQSRSVMCVDVRHPEFFIGLEAGGRVMSRCRFVPQVGNYYEQSPEEIIRRFQSQSFIPTRPASCGSCKYWGNLCQGGCMGEKDCDCLSSDCGYRTETTCGTWRFVDEYLSERGYKRGCYA